MLAVEKPADQPTQGEHSLETDLKVFIAKRDQKKGGVFLHAIHRLDRVASGIVLFAKSQKALVRLQEQMRQGTIERVYLAQVNGAPPGGRLEHYLIHGDHRALEGKPRQKEAKKALLEYVVLEPGIVEVHLITGRYHQIRAQFAWSGYPLLGDLKYGGAPWGRKGIALHHTKMVFSHPVQHRPIELTSKAVWYA